MDFKEQSLREHLALATVLLKFKPQGIKLEGKEELLCDGLS